MNIDKIFSENFSFEETALEVFKFQAENNVVYSDFIKALNISVDEVKTVEQIPFLPVQFFKTNKIITDFLPPPSSQLPTLFTSSGTTGSVTSSHYVKDVLLYEKSFLTCFQKFYGDVKNYCFIALLPSYLERDGSSLVYMCDRFIRESQHPLSGFYLNEFEKLAQTLNKLLQQNQKFILLGVTYALLDFAEYISHNSSVSSLGIKELGVVMETGGMKGKRKEMLREELHAVLKKSFGVSAIHSEYGMTELLSQAYSSGNGVYHCPPWLKILIRDINDPFTIWSSSSLPPGEGRGRATGGINIIDLANIHSCSFISTQDLGKTFADDSFEVLGRFDNSDLRGCNLMVE